MRPALTRPNLASPRLLGQIVQVDRRDNALEANVELANLTVRQGDDLHTPVSQPFVQAGNVLEIARETVDRFRQHGVELLLLGSNQQIKQTRPIVQRRPEIAASQNSVTTCQPCRVA